MKIRVRNPEHSIKIQKILFATGYSTIDSYYGDYLNTKFFYAYENGDITYGNDETNFDNKNNEEVSFDWLFPTICVDINGVEIQIPSYKKEEAITLIKGLVDYGDRKI